MRGALALIWSSLDMELTPRWQVKRALSFLLMKLGRRRNSPCLASAFSPYGVDMELTLK